MAEERVSVKRMQRTVEEYILEVKGVQVQVNIYRGYWVAAFPHAFLQDQLYKLNAAYGVAKEYFRIKT